jgi:hypothetical protein
MIYIPILIVIIILIIDFYFTYKIRLNKINNKDKDTFINNDIITFDEPNPWSKIELNNKAHKYFIKINNINKYIDKIIIWKQLPFIKDDMIDIDIENNYLIIKTQVEEEALVITNLIISYINGEINIDNIVAKKLINTSIAKAKKYKLVSTKLTELIKDGLHNLNNNQFTNIEEVEPIKKENIKSPVNNIHIPEVVQNIPLEPFIPQSKIIPYEGTEYATINF